jgi:hypothetical protein
LVNIRKEIEKESKENRRMKRTKKKSKQDGEKLMEKVKTCKIQLIIPLSIVLKQIGIIDLK